MSWYSYGEYTTTAERKKNIAYHVAKLKEKNSDLEPIVVQGRLQAKTFWGKAWFGNLKTYEDCAYRLGRGRTYVTNGAVLDLKIKSGEINALVCGTSLYKVRITIVAASPALWRNLIAECSGKINSLVELLQGKFSQHIMQIVSNPGKGLFPKYKEIKFDCSCPDYALMCKHVSAVLYGVGIRLDDSPEQLFLLRQIDHNELLLSATNNVSFGLASNFKAKASDGDLSQLFGIDIVEMTEEPLKKTKKKALVVTKKRVLTSSKKKRQS